jgi:hypothetical protein
MWEERLNGDKALRVLFHLIVRLRTYMLWSMALTGLTAVTCIEHVI